jgi:hypothetical protein
MLLKKLIEENKKFMAAPHHPVSRKVITDYFTNVETSQQELDFIKKNASISDLFATFNVWRDTNRPDRASPVYARAVSRLKECAELIRNDSGLARLSPGVQLRSQSPGASSSSSSATTPKSTRLTPRQLGDISAYEKICQLAFDTFKDTSQTVAPASPAPSSSPPSIRSPGSPPSSIIQRLEKSINKGLIENKLSAQLLINDLEKWVGQTEKERKALQYNEMYPGLDVPHHLQVDLERMGQNPLSIKVALRSGSQINFQSHAPDGRNRVVSQEEMLAAMNDMFQTLLPGEANRKARLQAMHCLFQGTQAHVMSAYPEILLKLQECFGPMVRTGSADSWIPPRKYDITLTELANNEVRLTSVVSLPIVTSEGERGDSKCENYLSLHMQWTYNKNTQTWAIEPFRASIDPVAG